MSKGPNNRDLGPEYHTSGVCRSCAGSCQELYVPVDRLLSLFYFSVLQHSMYSGLRYLGLGNHQASDLRGDGCFHEGLGITFEALAPTSRMLGVGVLI